MEEKDHDFRKDYNGNTESDDLPFYKERPSTTGGRIFGTVSEELHSSYKPKTSRLDLPSGCIWKEEIKKIEKDLAKKEEEIVRLKKTIK